MASLKPAYLIHGDDHGAVAERRARLRALAEADGGGAGGVELLEGDDAASPENVALALSAMTLAIGGASGEASRRVIVVEGAERYTDARVSEHIVPAMSPMPPDTTIAFFAREDGRKKAPGALHEAVRRAGGQIAAEMSIKPWELPAWVREQASRLGLALDAHAAKALVAQVGERQQRLLRELEKLALLHADGPHGPDRAEAAGELREGGPPGNAPAAGRSADGGEGGPAGRGERGAGERPVRVSAEDIEREAARSTAWRSFAFADALVAKDPSGALRTYVRLRAQGERISGLLYLMASRLREAESVAGRLAEGASAAEVKRTLRMPSRAADRFIADVSRTDPEQLRAALCRIADLELNTRGGAPLRASRTPLSSLEDDTLAIRAVLAITA